MAGADFSEEMNEVFQLLLDEVAKDIFKQNKRFGGNMAVAHAVFSRRQREALRKILGPECVFIVLNMSRDCQKKRVIARHGKGAGMDDLIDMMIKFAEMYEPAGEDEEGAYNVEITEDMNREDVIQKILEIIVDLEEKKIEAKGNYQKLNFNSLCLSYVIPFYVFSCTILVEEKYMPWKNGYWYTEASTSWIMMVKDDQCDTKNVVALDYPDTKSRGSSTWDYAKLHGEFGLADVKIFEATGVKYYNLKMEYNMFGQNLKVYGILNDEGTKLCFKGKIQKFNYKNRINFVCYILKLHTTFIL